MEFKDKLKALRNDRKLSQQALADAIHISRSAIAKWENGLGLNQLLYEHIGDPAEINAANQVLGLPHITKWYVGKPGDAILIYEEGMEIPPAPEEMRRRWGYKGITEPTQ